MRTACHIVAKSSLFAAISIYFVIFASTASNALPPQAIPEEAKASKPFPMISNASNALTDYLRTSPIHQCSGQVRK